MIVSFTLDCKNLIKLALYHSFRRECFDVALWHEKDHLKKYSHVVRHQNKHSGYFGLNLLLASQCGRKGCVFLYLTSAYLLSVNTCYRLSFFPSCLYCYIGQVPR